MDETLAVQINGLRVGFGNRDVLPKVDVSIACGQIVGVLGPSGAGKTTLIKSILGLHSFQQGTIRVFGHTVPSFTAMSQIGYMAQNDALYEDLTAMEHLLFFGRLGGLTLSEAKARAIEMLRFISLDEDAHRPVRDFSGGMRRRLSLAIALLSRAPLLILDEPTVGIDPILRKKMWEKFSALKSSGHTLLTTTHVMDEAERCDRLLLLREGRIIADGTPAELLERTGTNHMEDAFLCYSCASEKELA